MITVIQRVSEASVSVSDKVVAAIDSGILALVAVEKQDTEKNADRMLQKILNYRIFQDNAGKMNLSLLDIRGELLLVPQFTLAADTKSGNRPSFTGSAPPEQGRQLFTYLQTIATDKVPECQFGVFGADMQVELINDGPVTFILNV